MHATVTASAAGCVPLHTCAPCPPAAAGPPPSILDSSARACQSSLGAHHPLEKTPRVSQGAPLREGGWEGRGAAKAPALGWQPPCAAASMHSAAALPSPPPSHRDPSFRITHPTSQQMNTLALQAAARTLRRPTHFAPAQPPPHTPHQFWSGCSLSLTGLLASSPLCYVLPSCRPASPWPPGLLTFANSHFSLLTDSPSPPCSLLCSTVSSPPAPMSPLGAPARPTFCAQQLAPAARPVKPPPASMPAPKPGAHHPPHLFVYTTTGAAACFTKRAASGEYGTKGRPRDALPRCVFG
jgi:hypothetical protein